VFNLQKILFKNPASSFKYISKDIYRIYKSLQLQSENLPSPLIFITANINTEMKISCICFRRWYSYRSISPL